MADNKISSNWMRGIDGDWANGDEMKSKWQHAMPCECVCIVEGLIAFYLMYVDKRDRFLTRTHIDV